MKSEQRLLLALLCSMIVCAVWAHFMTEKRKTFLAQQKAKQPVALKTPGIQPIDHQKDPKPNTTIQPAPENKPEVVKPAVMPVNEEIIPVNTPLYYMEWTNRGAALKRLKFKKYCHEYVNHKQHDWQNQPDNWLELLPDYSSQYGSLALFGEETLSEQKKIELNQAIWQVVKLPDAKGDLKQQELVFETGPFNGVKYIKKFRFNMETPQSFIAGEIILQNVGSTEQKRTLEIGSGAGIILETPDFDMLNGFVTYLNRQGQPLNDSFMHAKMIEEKVQFEPPKKIETKGISWAGLINSYFGYVLQIDKPELIASMHTKSFQADEAWLVRKLDTYKKYRDITNSNKIQKTKHAVMVLKTHELNIPIGSEITLPLRFYLGSREQLERVDKSFEILHDYGFFAPISYLLLWILNVFYKIFNNYGIAIILLTLVVKLALYPLTKRQQVSMQQYQTKMKKFQPELKKIQDKYHNNRQKMQEEVMKLYKEHKINPFPVGGCLPIFLQLPILIGLYSALSYSIVLRQAGFLWIGDLSQPDHLFHFGTYVWGLGEYFNILPIVMTVVWMIQMKTAPMPEDPQMKQQQKIMQWMPLIFGFSFYAIASGLVLYWFIMQLISIIEQYYIKKAMAK